MKLAILTTETLHHAYFVREIAKRLAIARVYCETTAVAAPFDTSHPMDAARHDYENAVWFDGKSASLGDFAEVETAKNINDEAVISSMSQLTPDVAIVFGTRRLKPPILSAQPRLTFNLHGGDPQEYRGLDTHLWATYHRDFGGLVTTLHHITPELDDGDIVSQGRLPLASGLELHQLRRVNTEVCVNLVSAALAAIDANGGVTSHRQQRQGRYYSFMPSVLKEACRQRFSAHTRGHSFTEAAI